MPNCAFASEQEVLAQYSGSTTANYSYKPNCTFTVNKIVGDKFRGSFSATNSGKYNINQSVNGKVYENYDSFTCQFSLENYYNTSFIITVYSILSSEKYKALRINILNKYLSICEDIEKKHVILVDTGIKFTRQKFDNFASYYYDTKTTKTELIERGSAIG